MYKKIGKNKWLNMNPKKEYPWYYRDEQDKNGDKLSDNYIEEAYYEIVISETYPGKD